MSEINNDTSDTRDLGKDAILTKGFIKEERKDMKKAMIMVFAGVIILGIFTGYLLTRFNQPKNAVSDTAAKSESVSNYEKAVGSADTKTFTDSAEGTIEKGGSGAEGTHQLVRDGGPSQTVYLISSVVDLDEFIGKKVKVWGQTQAAKKVAWLMDVGRIEY